jgi:hypothetical protein
MDNNQTAGCRGDLAGQREARLFVVKQRAA